MITEVGYSVGFKGVVCGSFLENIWIVSFLHRIVVRKRKGQEGDDGDDGMSNVNQAREGKGLVRENGVRNIGGDLRSSCRFEVSALTP